MTTYTVTVKTSEWAGSESFQFTVSADSVSQASEQVRRMIVRDLPQGGEIMRVEVRAK